MKDSPQKTCFGICADSVPLLYHAFEKDYDLLPLTQLKTYIIKNKRLPKFLLSKRGEGYGLNLKENEFDSVKELKLLLLGVKNQLL